VGGCGVFQSEKNYLATSAVDTEAARCDAVRAASVGAPEALRGGRGCVAAWRCCAAAETAAAQHNGHGACGSTAAAADLRGGAEAAVARRGSAAWRRSRSCGG
jgi:hypothetical protein